MTIVADLGLTRLAVGTNTDLPDYYLFRPVIVVLVGCRR